MNVSKVLISTIYVIFVSLFPTNASFEYPNRNFGSKPAQVPPVSMTFAATAETTPVTPTATPKRILLIRHGCTYMNEQLATPGSQWGDSDFRDDWKFRDSRLSPKGVAQAEELCQRLRSTDVSDDTAGEDLSEVLEALELVVVSPLRRTIQTMELGVLPHLKQDPTADPTNECKQPSIPIVALPLASERVYLCSDVISPLADLQQLYPYIDFTLCTPDDDKENPSDWWLRFQNDYSSDTAYPNPSRRDVEWRPSENGQRYVCPGEPEDCFQDRMTRLYEWLERRDEQTIALVCHWGVLQWLTGYEFKNCEAKIVDFSTLAKET
mmetsp:Transcript_44475/g.52078  ORF Transcript_44475/g.52078 Transcript_44475/m.52078 type:complete len:323 (-) Transcript_44475:222-1190(-)